jgi:hypothetical protein
MIGFLLALVDWLRRFRQQSPASEIPPNGGANQPEPPHKPPPFSRELLHHVYASSFADHADVMAFRRCKARGGSDQECFKVGDNGEGYWGDDTTGPELMVALPPEDMIERWGSVDAAKHKPVAVTVGTLTKICKVADTMPHRVHITNGAGIDFSPSTCEAFELEPPVMVLAVWSWA